MDKIKKRQRQSHVKYGNKVVVVNNQKYDSELELYCHQYLTSVGINFEFQKPIQILPALKRSKEFLELANRIWQEPPVNKLGRKQKPILRKKNEQDISIIVDFFIEGVDYDVIIDTKGFETQDWINKAKTLEFQLAQKEKPTLFFTPNNKNQVIAVVSKLKSENFITKND